MFKIYLLVALRKLAKEKLYVAINTLSLAIGIGGFLVLVLYLQSELTFDQHFEGHEDIYRLSTHFRTADGVDAEFAVTQEGIGPLLVADYPQLGQHVRFRNASQNILRYEETRLAWEDLYLVDENVFEVFEHDILAGDPNTAFSDMNSIAVSESFARSYFGDEDPIGKMLESDSFAYRVTLVFADLPENTHLKYNALYPYSILSRFIPNYEDNYIRGLTGVNIYTYFKVEPTFDTASFDGIISSFVEKYMTEGLARMNSTFRAELTPLADIHFGTSLPGDRPNGNAFYLYGFSAVAVFLLLIACINYMNLATARATKRSKEVGMRKVVGASRGQLITQFLGESLVFTIIALVVGLVIAVAALTLTPIGDLMGKQALLSGLYNSTAVLGLIGLTICITLLAGLYPAFYLSSISPKAALSPATGSWKKGLSVRQFLVLAQMAISIGVISCTLLMSSQMRYLANKPLGFDKENKVWLDLRGADILEQLDPLKNELLADSNIHGVFDTVQVPGFGNGINMIVMEDNDGVMNPEQIEMIGVGLNYIQGLGIEVVEGRAFSEDREINDANSWMVNETLVRMMDWDEPIGKIIGEGDFEGRVIGVTDDFHYAPLNNEIGPVVIRPIIQDFTDTPPQTRPLQRTNLIINISGENIGETLSVIEEKIRLFDSGQVFDPSFLDARLDELYRSDLNLMGLTEIFAGVCILLSAMGLFGLASFNTQQRNKEIAIRKILGASSGQIIVLLCKNLAFLISIAAIPAILVSFITMNSWAEKFAYREELSLFGVSVPYLTAIVAVSAVALVTVAVQSLKTARGNPIEALRYE